MLLAFFKRECLGYKICGSGDTVDSAASLESGFATSMPSDEYLQGMRTTLVTLQCYKVKNDMHKVVEQGTDSRGLHGIIVIIDSGFAGRWDGGAEEGKPAPRS